MNLGQAGTPPKTAGGFVDWQDIIAEQLAASLSKAAACELFPPPLWDGKATAACERTTADP